MPRKNKEPRVVASVNFDAANRRWLLQQKDRTGLPVSYFVNRAVAEARRRPVADLVERAS